MRTVVDVDGVPTISGNDIRNLLRKPVGDDSRDVTTRGNSVRSSCQTDLRMSFSRHTTGLGLASAPYLKSSTYGLTLGPDFTWDAAWFANPIGQANTLTVNGQTIAKGTRVV